MINSYTYIVVNSHLKARQGNLSWPGPSWTINSLWYSLFVVYIKRVSYIETMIHFRGTSWHVTGPSSIGDVTLRDRDTEKEWHWDRESQRHRDSAVQCSAVQCSAVQCSAVQWPMFTDMLPLVLPINCLVLQHCTVLHSNAIHCTAVHCTVVHCKVV